MGTTKWAWSWKTRLDEGEDKADPVFPWVGFAVLIAWCRKRGLSSGLYKSDSQKKKERQLARSQHTAALLARTHQHTRRA